MNFENLKTILITKRHLNTFYFIYKGRFRPPWPVDKAKRELFENIIISDTVGKDLGIAGKTMWEWENAYQS